MFLAKNTLTRFLAAVALLTSALTPPLLGVSSRSKEVTVEDIIQALVHAQWKWNVSISEGTKSLTVELVELSRDGDSLREKSLVGEKGWFSVPLSGEKAVDVCILKMSGSHSIWIKAGIASGMYQLPPDLEWPRSSEYYPNKWQAGYLLLLRDLRSPTERFIALKLVEK